MSSEDEDILADEPLADVKKEAKNPSVETKEEPSSSDGEENAEENAARINSAKAFFRAMYAGDDVKAEQYGMNVETVKSINNSGTCSGCDNLSAHVEQLEAKYSEMEVLYKRMAADFENYRRRVDREREELLSLGIQKGVEAILPALDDLDRAKGSFNDNSELVHVIESMKLIADRFSKCLEQVGVRPLNPVGQPFDPRLHEPVQQVPAAHLPEGAVAHDLRRGYAMGEKVIRPALVNVVSNDLGYESNSSAEVDKEQKILLKIRLTIQRSPSF